MKEAHDWFLFAQQRGGLIQVERLLATIATQINRLTGGEAELSDFLPYMKPTNTGKEADIGEVMNILAMAAL